LLHLGNQLDVVVPEGWGKVKGRLLAGNALTQIACGRYPLSLLYLFPFLGDNSIQHFFPSFQSSDIS
jgi:hypothetical protein